MTADAQTLREIAERVEKLAGPSPKVDAEIFAVVVYRRDRLAQHPLRYTSSIDDALTLIPPGWELSFADTNAGMKWLVELSDRDGMHPLCRKACSWPGVEARTRDRRPAAIAFTVAALRALAASQEQRRG